MTVTRHHDSDSDPSPSPSPPASAGAAAAPAAVTVRALFSIVTILEGVLSWWLLLSGPPSLWPGLDTTLATASQAGTSIKQGLACVRYRSQVTARHAGSSIKQSFQTQAHSGTSTRKKHYMSDDFGCRGSRQSPHASRRHADARRRLHALYLRRIHGQEAPKMACMKFAVIVNVCARA